jgi:glutamine synthetase
MADALAAFRAEHPLIESVDLLLPDLAGIPRGKRITIEALKAALGEGAMFTSSLYSLDSTGANVERTGLLWEEGDADRPLALDPGTLRPVPWQPACAQIIGGLADHDRGPFFANPRTVLGEVAARFVPFGLRPVASLEFEFYLLDSELGPLGEPQVAKTLRHGRRPREREVYSHERLEDCSGILELVEQWCEAQDLPYKGALAEFAPGQFEVNLGHRDDMVQAADEALMLKRLIKAAARRSDRRTTFMAKPFAEESGSGLHIHVSLVDAAGRNAFGEMPDGEERLRHAVAGLQDLMAASMAIFAPNANSYRRFRPLSYAPMAPTWGHNNRTVALRIPAGPPSARRIEHRVAGADAPCHLALAAVLAGILHGLEHEGDPGPPLTGNAYAHVAPSLPITWDAALAAFAVPGPLHTFLGERFCRLYATCRRAERDRFQARVTPTEVEWYLSTV